MQVIKYPSLGSVDGGDYIKISTQILQKIINEGANDKALKRWMRGLGALDKDTFELLLGLLDIKVTGKDWTPGAFAKAMLEARTHDKRQDMIFERVVMGNEILAKYVFDALQERLYSTNELYRMLTSYVYPGKTIDLPDFNLWMKWMEGTGRVRVLGIRWAPGLRYPDSASYIASIDVDEILEEEAEEALLAEEGDGEPEEVSFPTPPLPEPTPAPAPAPVAPAPAPAPEPAGADVGWEPPEDDEEEFFDEPPARAAAPAAGKAVAAPVAAGGGGVDAAALAAAMASLAGAQRPSLIDARLLEPVPQASALAAGVPLERVREALAAEPVAEAQAWLGGLSQPEEVQAENLRALLEWYAGVSERPALRADQAGLMPFGAGGWEEGSRARFLFRLACLAVSALRSPGEEGVAGFQVLDQAGFFGRLYDEPGSAERLLDELFEQGLGGRPELFGQLHLYLMLARSLRGAEAWAGGLAELDDAGAVLAALWQRLAAYNLDLEVLWIAREMSMFGLWRQEGLAQVRVVPTPEARRAAFHLGFIESARAEGLPALVALSRRLTPMTEREVEGPLVALWRAYGAHPPRRFQVR